jgi:hypothetical protein
MRGQSAECCIVDLRSACYRTLAQKLTSYERVGAPFTARGIPPVSTRMDNLATRFKR